MSLSFKVCSSCRSSKPVSDFNKKRSGLQPNCRDCSKAISRDFYLANKDKHFARNKERKKLLAYYVIGRMKDGCVDCGEKDPVVLDFDHVTGEKVAGISTLLRYGMSKTKIDLEIEKCVVRCSNCHRRKTAKENNWLRLGPII